MNPETQKKLVELGFTEDKPGHFTNYKQMRLHVQCLCEVGEVPRDLDDGPT